MTDDSDILERARRAAAEAAQGPFAWKSYQRMWLDPPKPERWVCADLELGPGRPCGLWGYGGTGKSVNSMSIALAIASGKPVFDRFETRRGRVAYVSHEMGETACVERFRRLANGMLCDLADLEHLKLSTYPSINLNDSRAEEAYMREFDKFDLVVLDALRRAIPGEDENDSQVARHLDLLTRVSDRVGPSFLVVHHTSKDDVRGAAEGRKQDKRVSGRGSSAIYDGSSSIWLLEGHGKKPRALSQIRSHDDGDGRDEQYLVELVRPSIPQPLLEARGAPMRIQVVDKPESEESSSFDRVKTEILFLIATMPGINIQAIEARVPGKSTVKRQALSELEDENRITLREGPRNSKLYYPSDSSNNGTSR